MPCAVAGETLRLAQQLIARHSVTPDDDGCTGIIGERLERIGFKLESFDRGGVTNLWARRGTTRPLFCFAGHTDVVPGGPLEQWQSHPFQPAQRQGFLFGRGAADMKSSLAAFVTAVEDFVTDRPHHIGSIAFLLTSDEEGAATDGTSAVVDALAARGETIDYCVIGEPTSVSQLGDTIKHGRRGSLSGEMTIKGIQGHVAYPHLASNPILLVAPAIAELAGIAWDQGNESFPPTTWQISGIQGGCGAPNIIPGRVSIQFNFRYGTANSPEQLKTRFKDILNRHGLDYDLVWSLGAKPYLSGTGALIEASLKAIRDETGMVAEQSTTGGTSDGRFIAGICPQIVEIGPVNATIHKIDECIDIADLPRLSAIYRRILNQLMT